MKSVKTQIAKNAAKTFNRTVKKTKTAINSSLLFNFENTKTSISKKNKRNDATIAIEDSLIKKFVINGSNRRVNDFCLESPVKPIVKSRFL